MADFQNWDRQVQPQGNLVAPAAAPSLAESFSAGLADLANTAAATVDSVRKADEWRKNKEWEIVGQPKAAALVNKLQLDIAAQLPDIKAKAAPGLADYPDKINQSITGATEEALKDNPDPQFQRYVRASMDDFRVSSVASGIQEKTAATLAHDASALQQLVNDQSGLVDKDFGQFDRAAKLIDDTINGNQHFSADQKAELSRISKNSIAIAGLNSLKEHDPEAAMRALNSGKFDTILDIADKQGFLADIKSEQDRKIVEAKIAADGKLQAKRDDLNARLKPAFDQALQTGKYDRVSNSEIISIYGEKQGNEIIADLNNARYMGQDTLSITHQSPRADSQLLRMLSDVANAHKDDERAQLRLAYAQGLISNKRTGILNNPEEYVRTHTPAVQEKWDAFAEKPSDPDRVSVALETAVQAQRKQGVPRDRIDPVPQTVADGAVAFAKNAGPAAIGYLQRNFGAYAPHLIEKIAAKYGPFVTTVFIMDQPSQQPAQAALLKLSQEPQAVHNLEQTLAIDDTKRVKIQKAVFEKFEKVRKSYADQSGGDAVFSKLSESGYALALYYMLHDGQDVDAASSRAAGEIAADHYTFREVNKHTYRVPLRNSGPGVALGTRRYLENLIDTKVDTPSDNRTIGKETVALSLKQYGWWSNLPDESGLMLRFQNGTPATRDGNPIVVTWREFELLASHHPEPHYSSASRYHQ